MKHIGYRVQGEEVAISVAETPSDLEEFHRFYRANAAVLAADSETTGLDTYAKGHRSRLWQFGNKSESWVIPVELGGPFERAASDALRNTKRLFFQNASFDLQEADRHLGVRMEELWHKVTDTKILAHLIDPRGREEGGTGHGLVDLVSAYVDKDMGAKVKGSMGEMAADYKSRKLIKKQAEIWQAVETFDPIYNLYAGMDTILTARLANALIPKVPQVSHALVKFEHEVAEICAFMERTGFRLDTEYAERLSAEMSRDEERWKTVAASLGVDKVGSAAQVAEALLSSGVKLTKKTDSGAWSVDSSVLGPLAEQGNELAQAVTEAKKMGKWRTTWVDTFLETVDGDGRCHASIQPLRARTGRMSITGIPAQTLPSSDWKIRRCFVADPGDSIASVDYAAQELRVLAALSGDTAMIEAFKHDADLHQITADAAGVPRKVGKTANFQKVYGGGAGALARAVGISEEVARKVHKAFDAQYTGVARLNKQLQSEARANGYVVTPSGRRLPVDEDRAYSALNYMVQSTSRDVTCRGLVKLHRAGMTKYLRLPIHDEVIASLPRDEAEEIAQNIGDLMSEHMGPVYVNTDPAVPGKHWGSEYCKDEQQLEKEDAAIKAVGLW